MTIPEESPSPLEPSQREHETRFLDAVADLERAASAPPVIGETLAWCSRIAQELARLTDRYPGRRHRHDALRDELIEEQPAGTSKRRDTAQRERRLGTQLAELRHRIDTLIDASAAEGFDEPFQQAKETRLQLLAWCVAARAIDAEINANVMEAHYRDRGTVD